MILCLVTVPFLLYLGGQIRVCCGDGTSPWQQTLQAACEAQQQRQRADAERLINSAWETLRQGGPAAAWYADGVQQIAEYRRSQGYSLKSEAIYKDALETAARLGQHHPTYIGLLNNLAQFYANEQQDLKAQHTYEQALKIETENAKQDFWIYHQTIMGLGALYDSGGKLEQAEGLYRRLEETPRKLREGEIEDPSYQIAPLAQFYARRRKTEQAELLYRQALASAEAKPGPGHMVLLNSLRQLMWFLHSQKRWAEAEDVQKRIIATQETADTGDSSRYERQTLARLYLDAGKNEEGNKLLSGVLTEVEQTQGADSPEFRQALLNYAQAHSQQKNYAEAEKALQQFLSAAEGADDFMAEVGLWQLAQLYDMQGDHGEAEQTREKATALQRKRYPQPVQEQAQDAMRALDKGQIEEGRARLERALLLAENTPGPSACGHASFIAGAAYALPEEEAERMVVRAAAICDRVLGPDSPENITGRRILANYYSNHGRFAAAERLLRQEVVALEAAKGPDNPALVGALEQLAGLASQQGKQGEAERIWLEDLALQEAARGRDHPQLVQVISSVARFYDATIAGDKAEPFWLRALALSEKANDINRAWLLAGFADSLGNRQEYDRAAEYYLQAIETARHEPADAGNVQELERRRQLLEQQKRKTAPRPSGTGR